MVVASTSSRPVADRAILNAASIASAPLLANVTRSSPSGASSTSRAASSPAAAGTDGCTNDGSPVSWTAATAAQIAGSLCPKGSAP